MVSNKPFGAIASLYNHLSCLRHKGYCLMEDMPKEKKQFFLAALTGDLWAIQRTMKKYPDAAKWQNKDGITGLMFAAREGRENVVRFLIPRSDLKAKTGFGFDALRFSQGTPRGVAHPGVTSILREALDTPVAVANEEERILNGKPRKVYIP